MFGVTSGRRVVVLPVLAMALVLFLAATVSAGGPVIHRVHVGGPDACEAGELSPGCDGNWSLTAIQHGDGRVTGQLTDQWGGGAGFHATIDCLYVDGNEAWVSGVITQGKWGDWDMAGEPVSARVRDNGTSANDPPDQFSYSHIGADGGDHPHGTCDEKPDYGLMDVTQGQVVVD